MSRFVFLGFLLIFFLLIPLPGIADDYNYEVYGYGDDGYLSGEVEVKPDSKEVEGYLYTDDGRYSRKLCLRH